MIACRFARIIASGAVFWGLSLGILCTGRAEETVAKPASLSSVQPDWIRKAVDMTLQQNPVSQQSLEQMISQGQECVSYVWMWLFTSPLYHEESETDWVKYYQCGQNGPHKYDPIFVAPKMEFVSPLPGTVSYPPPSYLPPMN